MASAVIGVVLPSLTTLNACMTFEESLRRLHIHSLCGAYGAPTENCNVSYKVYQRESWLQSVIDAQTIVERDIGRPICPSEICDEVHPCMDEIALRHKSIAYLGTKEWSVWASGTLVEEIIDSVKTGRWYLDICDSELPADFSPEYIQFSYPDEILSCYRGLQALQVPCAERLLASCGIGLEDGWRFSWQRCQLIRPDVDTANPASNIAAELAKFIASVKWRTYTIDASIAAEWVGHCDCGCCVASTAAGPTVRIVDAQEGIICVDNNCVCTRGRRLRINYATSMDCYGANDDLLRAVALLALAAAGNTPAKPCNCDNTFLDRMMEIDPTATTEFASRIRYGPTFAQMEAMRIVNGYLKRPVKHRGVETGGQLSARKGRTRRLAW